MDLNKILLALVVVSALLVIFYKWVLSPANIAKYTNGELCRELSEPIENIKWDISKFNYRPNDSTQQVTGLNIFVVGASKGIGKAVSEKFQQNGNSVIGTSRVPANYSNSKVKLVKLDVKSERQTRSASKIVGKMFGNKIDILVLCPALFWNGDLQAATGDDLQNIFDTNLAGYQRVVNNFAPMMKHTKTKIFTFGSIAGEIPIMGAYSMTKRALQFWNDAHQFNSQQRLASGMSENEPVFILIEPGYVKTTLGLYEFAKPSSQTKQQLRQSHYPAAALQSILSQTQPEQIANKIFEISQLTNPETKYILDKIPERGDLISTLSTVTPVSSQQLLKQTLCTGKSP